MFELFRRVDWRPVGNEPYESKSTPIISEQDIPSGCIVPGLGEFQVYQTQRELYPVLYHKDPIVYISGQKRRVLPAERFIPFLTKPTQRHYLINIADSFLRNRVGTIAAHIQRFQWTRSQLEARGFVWEDLMKYVSAAGILHDAIVDVPAEQRDQFLVDYKEQLYRYIEPFLIAAQVGE